jgi:hypothetical protein
MYTDHTRCKRWQSIASPATCYLLVLVWDELDLWANVRCHPASCDTLQRISPAESGNQNSDEATHESLQQVCINVCICATGAEVKDIQTILILNLPVNHDLIDLATTGYLRHKISPLSSGEG